MGFFAATTTCFRKYFVLSGRASRSEYWWFFLFLILLGVAAVGVDAAVFGLETLDSDSAGPFELAANLLTLIPSITATVRRLHDTNRPGYYILMPLLFVFGAFLLGALGGGILGQSVTFLVIGVIAIGTLLMLYWLAKPSDSGPNRYGPHPFEVQTDYGEVFQ